MSTYYERKRDEVIALSWEEAFIKLMEEVLDEHYHDARDFARIYLKSKGYRIIGESVEKALKMFVVVDLEKWAKSLDVWKEPETVIGQYDGDGMPARILGKDDVTIVSESPAMQSAFSERKAVRFLIEIGEIKPEDWEVQEKGVYYGGTPDSPRTSFTKPWE